MTKNSYDGMNALTAKCFNANAIIDNLAYSLDFHYYNRIATIVHLNMAHVMPEFADLITDEMLLLSARPVRLDIGGYTADVESLESVFSTLGETFLDLRNSTAALIEAADMDGDDEVKLFLEEFLMKLQPYIKQVEEWQDALKKIGANDLNLHINDYTHFINR